MEARRQQNRLPYEATSAFDGDESVDMTSVGDPPPPYVLVSFHLYNLALIY